MESSLPVELVPNLNRIAHGIELELELMQKNHENPSPDSNPSLELIQPYWRITPGYSADFRKRRIKRVREKRL